MFGSYVPRQLIAAIGAILMSTVAVAAAVAPANVSSPSATVNA